MEDKQFGNFKYILAWDGDKMKNSSYKGHKFYSFQEAEEVTHVSELRIRACIRSGQRWRGWTFDYVEEMKND